MLGCLLNLVIYYQLTDLSKVLHYLSQVVYDDAVPINLVGVLCF